MLQAVLMALSYKPVDRDQLFLLPPDMREWLPENHLAFFVLEVLERLDTAALHEAHPNEGAGRQAYDPDMLLGLLLYAYCMGERSSRQIERLCQVDVAFRVIAANHRPDHSTIARFRSENAKNLAALFSEVLRLCHEAGLLNLGVVAVDGTKMKANASIRANRTRGQIEAEVNKILAEAAEVDAREDEAYGRRRGDELPPELADPQRRKARLDAALAALEKREAKQEALAEAEEEKRKELENRAAAEGRGPIGRPRRASLSLESLEANLEAAEADYRAQVTEWRQRRDEARSAGEPVSERPSRERTVNARRRLRNFKASPPPPPAPVRALQVNTTDPESQIMCSPQGWVQGYNAQAAVDSAGFVLSARVTASPTDREQCQPMMAATMAELEAAGVEEAMGTMLFDAGYCSTANITAPGPDRLIATTKSFKLRRDARLKGYATGEPREGASPIEQMEHRLRTEEGFALYGLRQVIVEPAFGDLKENLGFRAFLRRGLEVCEAEWKLICTVKNLRKLFASRQLGPQPS